ncbi:MAG TPA: ABC transporter permease [Paludibacteraceae bacterium]|nr:ABC transporter permease [Paludibacteraceae bacterium]
MQNQEKKQQWYTRIRQYVWSLFVAQRYLFSKKSHNTINIISIVSMCGVAVGSMALICVLSVLNGFEEMVQNSFTSFDPDLKITSQQGRVFDLDTEGWEKVRILDGVELFSEIFSGNVLVGFNGRQTPATVKGVSDNYAQLTGIKTLMIDGSFTLRGGAGSTAVVGVGVANTLSLGVDFVSPVALYVPKRNVKVNLTRPETAFRQHYLYASGVFAANQPEYDDEIVFVPIELAQELFDYSFSEVSSVEIKVKSGSQIEKVEEKIQAILGDSFTVQNRYEQQADFYRILQIEKWITFLILAFILLIATCNIIGSLSMLMINKQQDIALFFNLGADTKIVQFLFLLEGWMISVYGAVVGLAVGITLCLIQQYVGIIKMGEGFIVENYPVVLELGDVFLVFFTVVILGFLLASYPASVLRKHRVTKDDKEKM